jgi:sugar transferase (PEP-CTERM/EpsH1 system associated)
MALRILHVVDNVGRGGMQNGLLNLIDRLDPRAFEHVICAIRHVEPVDGYDFNRDWARVMCLDKAAGGSRTQIGDLVRVIREVQPDIVHSRNWSGIEGVLAGYWAGSCRLVHSEHGLDTSPNAKEPWRRLAFRCLSYRLADRVFCVSHQLKDLFARRTGFAERKIDVIHNGVDMRRFSPDPAARVRVRREFGISENEFLIGCVGNLTHVKDHRTVLEAVCNLAREHQDWRLVILGKGPELPKLESFLAGHPEWKHRVSFPGRSDRVAEMLNAMDVYVLPSLAEGICNSLLEAMATGLPVVVTATGGNPEVVVDGESGLLFPVGDSRKLAEHLLLLTGRPDVRAEFGRQALNRVCQSFSIDSMVRQYEQLYESLGGMAAAPVRAAAGV